MICLFVGKLYALHLMAVASKWSILGHKYKLVHTWRVKVDHLTLCEKLTCLFHELIDMLLQYFFILPPHLRADTRHDLLAAIAVSLSTARLLPDNILRVAAGVDAFHIFVYLYDEFASVTKNDRPCHSFILIFTTILLRCLFFLLFLLVVLIFLINLLTFFFSDILGGRALSKKLEWIEIRFLICFMCRNLFKNHTLTPQKSCLIRKIDLSCIKILILCQESVPFLIVLFLILDTLVEEHRVHEALINLRLVASSCIDDGHVRLTGTC